MKNMKNTIEPGKKGQILSESSRILRDFTSILNTLRCSNGEIRFKSGAYESWLKATPTHGLYLQQLNEPPRFSLRVGAASCRNTNFDNEQQSPRAKDVILNRF